MRIIEKNMVNALAMGRNFQSGNTRVESEGDISKVYLHNNLIAVVDESSRTLRLSSAGWETATTKSRLNAIADQYGVNGIYQRNYAWYFKDGTEFEDMKPQSF